MRTLSRHARRSAPTAGTPLLPGPAMVGTAQVTSGTGACDSFGASIGDNGQRTAVRPASDRTGQTGDHGCEIFLYDRPGPPLTQVTRFTGAR